MRPYRFVLAFLAMAALSNRGGGGSDSGGGLQISPATLPNGSVGAAYSEVIAASGCSGVHAWSFGRTLPQA